MDTLKKQFSAIIESERARILERLDNWTGRDADRIREIRGILADLPIRWNGRLSRSLGRCRFKVWPHEGIYRVFEIDLSSRLFLNPSESMPQSEVAGVLVNTIRHEFAHALASHGRMDKPDHGLSWKSWAQYVGANPMASSDTRLGDAVLRKLAAARAKRKLEREFSEFASKRGLSRDGIQGAVQFLHIGDRPR